MAENIIIVGGVALGSKAACRVKRLAPEANVVIIDQSEVIAYGGCGIPYFVSGDVPSVSELRTTSYHMIRDESFFDRVKGVKVMAGVRVTGIDRQQKTVQTQRADGHTASLPYDKLVLGIGSRPRKLDIPGANLPQVLTAANLTDAENIQAQVAKGQVEKAVIVGAGFIGLEMAEALADMWEIETTVVEFFPQIMPGFVSPDMARMAMNQMQEKGVTFYLDEQVQAIVGDRAVRGVKTDKRQIDADLVIMAVGAQPATELARDAGLETIGNGAIVVDAFMRTTDPDIYAGGDCVAVNNSITGKPAFYPLGSMANRQGRVIGTNLAGGQAEFRGAVGSWVVKLFDASMAGAGLSIENARREGFDAVSLGVTQFDKAHFYPEKELMYLELVVDKPTRRVLGIQGLGSQGDAMVGRINMVAAILDRPATVDDISNIELAYSPPFASAMDVLNALGNAVDNFLAGRLLSIKPRDFSLRWQARKDAPCLFLDCRAKEDSGPYAARHPDAWKAIPQDELKDRMHEVPTDCPIYLICNTGVRSYEAQLNLRQAGIVDTLNLEGGMAALRKSGLDVY